MEDKTAETTRRASWWNSHWKMGIICYEMAQTLNQYSFAKYNYCQTHPVCASERRAGCP